MRKKGVEHETRVLAQLEQQYGEVVRIPSSGSLAEREALTITRRDVVEVGTFPTSVHVPEEERPVITRRHQLLAIRRKHNENTPAELPELVGGTTTPGAGATI